MTTDADRIQRMRARRNEIITGRTSTATIILVTGPPCSGKTTYVRKHSNPGDTIIDFDALAVALGSPDSHDHSSEIMPVATAAWAAALAEARRHTATVWLVRVFPTPTDLALASEAITLDVPADECKRRADAEGRPAAAVRVIEAWHDRHDAMSS